MRTKTISIKVEPELLEQAQQKLDKFNQDMYDKATNKRQATKCSIADIFEQCLINYIHKD